MPKTRRTPAMPRQVRLVGAASLAMIAGSATIRGDVVFRSSTISHTAGAGEASYTARFDFVNDGNEPVTIREAISTCGCTVPSLTKQTYEPGESGVITATFNYGSRVGEQRKVITVSTSDPDQPEIKLQLVVNIPEIVRVTPRIVIWRGDDRGLRTVSLDVVDPDPVTVKKVTAHGLHDGDTPFVVAQLITRRKGEAYELRLTPREDTPESAQARIVIETDRKGSRVEQIEVFAYAMPERPPRRLAPITSTRNYSIRPGPPATDPQATNPQTPQNSSSAGKQDVPDEPRAAGDGTAESVPAKKEGDPK